MIQSLMEATSITQPVERARRIRLEPLSGLFQFMMKILPKQNTTKDGGVFIT